LEGSLSFIGNPDNPTHCCSMTKFRRFIHVLFLPGVNKDKFCRNKKPFMNKILLFVLALTTLSAQAQCDKKITWNASKTEYLSANGEVENSVTEPSTIEMTLTKVTLVKGFNANDVVSGEITQPECNWTEPYRKGKTSFSSQLFKTNGENRHASITIEGVEGKVAITLAIEGMEGKKIRLLVDSYQQKD
jgi:hypothetical protein